MNRQDFILRIRGAEEECKVALLSVARLSVQTRRDPGPLAKANLSHRNVRDCLDNLEATFIVRIFAEFESALRHYWKHTSRKRALPRTHIHDLIDKTASHCHIDTGVLARTHDVRECRNRLVHEQPAGPALTLGECRSFLGRFLGYTPFDWA